VDPTDAASLVPLRRLGAALSSTRQQSRATLTAVARRAEGRWTPAELRAVEQGTVPLDDDEVAAACALYGVANIRWSVEDLRVVLDRSTEGRPGGDAEGDGVPRLVSALGTLLGVSMHEVPGLVPALASARTCAPEDVLAELESAQSAAVDESTVAIGARLVVPSVGILVGDSHVGTIVLVGRPGRRGRGPLVTGTLALRDLAVATRAAVPS
jgi:hypothetical protein